LGCCNARIGLRGVVVDARIGLRGVVVDARVGLRGVVVVVVCARVVVDGVVVDGGFVRARLLSPRSRPGLGCCSSIALFGPGSRFSSASQHRVVTKFGSFSRPGPKLIRGPLPNFRIASLSVQRVRKRGDFVRGHWDVRN